MKLTIVFTSNNPEKIWNAFRFANLCLKKGEEVNIFLIGDGIEYDKNSSDKFNIKILAAQFLKSEKAKISACQTCMDLRDKKGSQTCPVGGILELYNFVKDSDKILTF